jgi:hypothetical protein
VEANTSHSTAEALVKGQRRGLRARISALTTLRGARKVGRSAARGGDEPTLRLDQYLSGSKARVLHHRTLPGVRAEISHLIIGPAGVTVVDSRHYPSGRARIGQGELRVGKRRRADLIDALLERVGEVRNLLADTPYSEVPVEGALAYGQVDGPPTLKDAPRILVSGTRRIAGEASRPGPLSARRVNALAAYLERSTSE